MPISWGLVNEWGNNFNKRRKDANFLRSSERMRDNFNKRRKVEVQSFNFGDFVTLAVPKKSRTKGDQGRVARLVVEKLGEKHFQYRIRFVMNISWWYNWEFDYFVLMHTRWFQLFQRLTRKTDSWPTKLITNQNDTWHGIKSLKKAEQKMFRFIPRNLGGR